MRISEQRVEALAQAIVDRLAEDELIDLTIDEEKLADVIEAFLVKDLAQEDAIQRDAVEWLRINRRHLLEGTDEWEIALEQKRDDLAVARGYILP